MAAMGQALHAGAIQQKLRTDEDGEDYQGQESEYRRTCGCLREILKTGNRKEHIKLKNKVYILLVSIIMLFIFTGCSTKSPDNAALLSGTYGPSEDNATMEMDIDLSENKFTINILDNKFLEGQIEIEDDKLVAVTDDEKFEYVFEIEDEKTLKFIPEQSDSLVSVSGGSCIIDMSDGLEFELLSE